MLNRTAADWERLRELPALLQELPLLAEALGFHFYSFSYTSPTHEVYASNLLSGGQRLVQAALDFRLGRHLHHANMPVLWTEASFMKRPHLWNIAQVLGLRHGWIQPLYDGVRQSSLALLRPHVSLSTMELYPKAAQAMWLGERLHHAAICSAAVSGDQAPSSSPTAAANGGRSD